ncbi:unnamed protein product [Miscanthus lutarioriparius]|uniref:DUF4408 domain-containing protein n=1 Tax=Miscanthus lutarioriparius TaxID=422564 RepID=A0A811R642_9POAL|nr:unnamed protein product [Miscanthus lutarioriparius]
MAVEYLSGWPLSSWISPGAALFLFVNVLIGAIVVTSRGHHQGGRAAAASTRRLCRSASSMVLDRLRSFSMFAVPVEEYYSTSSPELELEAEELEQPHQPAVVAEPARSPVAAAVAAPEADGASSKIAKEEAGAGEDMSTSSDDEAAHSLALQQPPSVDVVSADEATAAVESQSQEEKLAETTMQHRAPACRREAEEALEGKAALNARAESFIRRFREDLKLERLNSIINYTRTLRRGAGAASASPTAQ